MRNLEAKESRALSSFKTWQIRLGGAKSDVCTIVSALRHKALLKNGTIIIKKKKVVSRRLIDLVSVVIEEAAILLPYCKR
jgi:hypothetical protein